MLKQDIRIRETYFQNHSIEQSQFKRSKFLLLILLHIMIFFQPLLHIIKERYNLSFDLGSMPDLVTPTFASAYLMALAAGNLGGR